MVERMAQDLPRLTKRQRTGAVQDAARGLGARRVTGSGNSSIKVVNGFANRGILLVSTLLRPGTGALRGLIRGGGWALLWMGKVSGWQS